jgi:hypothetical protein
MTVTPYLAAFTFQMMIIAMTISPVPMTIATVTEAALMMRMMIIATMESSVL